MFHAHAQALAAELQGRWAEQPQARSFTLLCSHFGEGQAFHAVLQAWRDSPRRPQRLVFVSSAARWPEAAPPAGGTWPPPTPNLHLLDFEAGRVRLLLALGHAEPWRQLRQVQADALWLDGRDFDPGADRTRPARATGAALKTLARLSAPQARLALWQSTPEQVAALHTAGFVFEADAAEVQLACFQPRLQARHPTAAAQPLPAPGHAVIVGAGIAGACAAAALAQRGWRCTVLDARARPAGGASGNPAAIFHGTVHAADGPHARFTRAAALHAQRVHGALIARGVPGRVDGLLRAGALAAAQQQPPAGWASIWSAAQLQASGSGLRADSAWYFPGGGWIDAAAAVNALLQSPGIAFRGQAHAAALRPHANGWQVLDTEGQPLAEPGVVVLAGAGAGDARATPMAGLLAQAAALAWPVARARGQVSWFRHAGASLPWPLAGGGYALSLPDTTLLCGATTQADDEETQPRDDDHAFNLARLQAQTGIAPGASTPLQGRVGWRERSPDRLPVIGAAVDARKLEAGTARTRPAAPDRLPRAPGLFVLGAMAGRGFTWGPLAGEVLASWVDGSPWPLEADLLEALDPARFWLRQARRGSSGLPRPD